MRSVSMYVTILNREVLTLPGMKALIADDDQNVLEITHYFLAKHNIDVVTAENGEDAVQLVESEAPDIIILDVMMPKLDGYETCRTIRKFRDTPIIMLTARGEEVDKVIGFELGADDYITKPFGLNELLARMKAIFRYKHKHHLQEANQDDTHILQFDDLVIHTLRREVFIHGESVQFKPKEFDMLVYLARLPGQVFTRDQLLEQVWGYDYMGDIRTVDVHVMKVRAKLQAFKKDCIETVWGVGYKFQL